MTQQLALRLKNGLSPFDGKTLSMELVSIANIRHQLELAFKELYRVSSDLELVQNQDWHWHDGYINRAETVTWQEVLGWTESVEDVMRGWCAEDHCHRAVYPKTFEWVLRYSLDESIFPHIRQPDKSENYWDFSGDVLLVTRIAAILSEAGYPSDTVEDSVPWFEQNGNTSDYYSDFP
jgi:hypothetical protein